MLFKKIQNHVTALTHERRIHRHLAEQILYIRAYDGERPEAVPQVVKGEKALGAHLGALVFGGDKRASELHSPRHVVLHELVREVEHVACGEHGLAVSVNISVASQHITVSSDYFLLLRIPYDELLIAVVARVELVYVHALAAAAAGLTECDFAQAAYFLHHVRRVVRRDYVDLVMALVGHAQLPVRRKFALEHFLVYRKDDVLFHFIKLLMVVVDIGNLVWSR